jgi:hypothetical protein
MMVGEHQRWLRCSCMFTFGSTQDHTRLSPNDGQVSFLSATIYREGQQGKLQASIKKLIGSRTVIYCAGASAPRFLTQGACDVTLR